MRQTIANLEKELDDILRRYETEHEITLAEVAGILDNLKLQRQFRVMLPFMKDELKNVLNEPVEAVSGAPMGEPLHIIEREDDMET
jgi:hypothetical protein